MQKEFQIEQASNAISIYYEIADNHHKASKQSPSLHQSKQFKNDGSRDASVASCPAADQPIEKTNRSVSEKAVHDLAFSSYGLAKEKQNETYHINQQIVHQNIRDTDTKPKPESTKTATNWKPVFDELHAEIKLRHYSPKTLKSYSSWLAKFQAFTKSKPVASLNDADIKAFLTFLAVKKSVAASTQNVAFNALLFFFRHVLKKEPGELKNIARAKRRPYIPVVLSRQEIDRIFQYLSHPYDLIAKLLYGFTPILLKAEPSKRQKVLLIFKG